MKKILISEITRIHEIMGVSVITEAINPFVTLLRNAAKGLEKEMSTILGRQINNVDEITAKDIPILLKSQNKSLRQLSTKAWGISKSQFQKKTYDELAQELSQKGLPASQINRYIKNASEEFGEPKGGLPTRPIGKGKTKPVEPSVKPKPDDLKPSTQDLAELISEGQTAEEAIVSWYSEKLKKFRLPGIPEGEVDDFLAEVVAQVKQRIPQIKNFEYTSERILKEFQTLPRDTQRAILVKVQKEMYKGGMSQELINSFKFFNNPSLKLYGYKEIMKKTLGLNVALTISTIVSDVIRGIYDYKEGLDWNGHFGMSWFPTFLTKLVVNFLPGLNLAFNSILFLESIMQGVIDFGIRSGKSDDSEDLDDLMQQKTGEN